MSGFCQVSVRYLSDACQVIVRGFICKRLGDGLLLFQQFSTMHMPAKYKYLIAIIAIALLLIAIVCIFYKLRIDAMEERVLQQPP